MKSTLLSRLSLFAILATPLPEQLPADYLTAQGHIPFNEPGNTSTPLFSTMEVNGVTAHASDVAQIFSDTTYAFLPLGTTISKQKDSNGREVWEYPLGTEVAHEITFKDQTKSLFELRMLKKVGDGQWDFASYSPSSSRDEGAPATSLVRNHYTGAQPLSLTLTLTNGTRPKIDLKRINLNSCRNCHFVNSVAAYQYHGYNEAGPCGFTPNNDAGIKPWIDVYLARFGHSPFAN